MLVFDEGSIDHILEVAIVRIRPARGTHALPVPANILFLCARFAHYYNGPELLETFFEKAVDKICEVIRVWDCGVSTVHPELYKLIFFGYSPNFLGRTRRHTPPSLVASQQPTTPPLPQTRPKPLHLLLPNPTHALRTNPRTLPTLPRRTRRPPHLRHRARPDAIRQQNIQRQKPPPGKRVHGLCEAEESVE